jgi:hypothetical protein
MRRLRRLNHEGAEGWVVYEAYEVKIKEKNYACLILRRKQENTFFVFMKSLLWIFFETEHYSLLTLQQKIDAVQILPMDQTAGFEGRKISDVEKPYCMLQPTGDWCEMPTQPDTTNMSTAQGREGTKAANGWKGK